MQKQLLTFTLLVLLGLIAVEIDCKKFTCNHDEMIRGYKPKKMKLSEAKSRKLLGMPSQWRPIQIAYDYGGLRGLDAKKAEFIMNDLIPQVTKVFQSFIQVKYIPGHKWGIQSRQCMQNIVPISYMHPVIDADLVVFVNMKDEPQSGFLAMAAPCSLDPITNRPNVGAVNFNLQFTDTSAQGYKQMIEIVIHEMIHVFGFSKPLFEMYIDEFGRPKGLHNVFRDVMARGEITGIITLPGVRDHTRKYFNCPIADGSELENQGPPESRGSHWERRNWMNEMMTASNADGVVLTNLTLNLLHGTGWYKIDFSAAQEMSWGKGAGCSFLTEPCVDKKGFATYKGFCPALQTEGCSWRGNYKAHCNVMPPMEPIPHAFNYLGGMQSLDRYADNCPYFSMYENGDCRNPEHAQTKYAKYYDETFGHDSRCFSGNFIKQGAPPLPPGKPMKHGTCLKQKCKKNPEGRDYVEIILGRTLIPCPPNGGPVQIPGYTGTLDCPSGEQYCLEEVVNDCADKNFCGGVGYCWKNKCICPPGYYGENCMKPMVDCSKVSCGGRGRCMNNQCVCEPGYSGVVCEKVATTMNCRQCASGICHGKQCVPSLSMLFS